MMDAQFVFDVRTQPYSIWVGSGGPIGMAIASVLIGVIASALPKEAPRRKLLRVISSIAFVALVGVATFIVVNNQRDYKRLTEALDRGTYVATEGLVTDLVPQRPTGHPIERFRIGSRQFSYSAHDLSPGFHWTVGFGGPIREGQLARIFEVNGQIARLEILKK